jgi:hypothetical protein
MRTWAWAWARSPTSPLSPVDVDLVVRSIPQGTLQAGKSFSVTCALGGMASVQDGQQQEVWES